MKLEQIIEIAEDRIVSDLCIKFYFETDQDMKKKLFDEIQRWYRKINKLAEYAQDKNI